MHRTKWTLNAVEKMCVLLDLLNFKVAEVRLWLWVVVQLDDVWSGGGHFHTVLGRDILDDDTGKPAGGNSIFSRTVKMIHDRTIVDYSYT